MEDATLTTELAPEFEVVRPLGKGGVADVFLAREVQLGRLVGVKVLRRSIAADETARRRFMREARSAARISHPHVVAVHRVGTLSDERPYLVMEYVAGRDLESLLAAEGPVDPREGPRMLAQLARAIEAAHAHGIVHRDVRPANVLREESTGRIVLTDFGIAGVLEREGDAVTRLTAVGERLGQIRYSSPEQLQGEVVTAAADVYSLAITAYEILAGRGPYEGERPAELIRAHLQEEPTPLDRLRPGIEPVVADLFLRCLAKRPEHRPSIGQVGRVLEEAAATAATPAAAPAGIEPPGALRGFLSELKRRRVYNMAVGYVAVAYIVLQAADVILPALPLPEWVHAAVVLVALAGFPLVLVLAWMYDLTAHGVRRTRGGGVLAAGTLRSFQLAGLILSLALAALLGWWLLG